MGESREEGERADQNKQSGFAVQSVSFTHAHRHSRQSVLTLGELIDSVGRSTTAARITVQTGRTEELLASSHWHECNRRVSARTRRKQHSENQLSFAGGGARKAFVSITPLFCFNKLKGLQNCEAAGSNTERQGYRKCFC